MKKKYIIIGIGILLVLGGYGLSKIKPETNSEVNNIPSERNEYSSQIIVDIKGSVKYPGIYYLNKESRVIDAITIAGGLTVDADIDKINLATKLEDGMVVNIFKKEAGTSSKLSINKATVEELMKLPGIGEVKAKAIVDYREKHGYYMSLEDIKKADGINEATYKQIKELISL